MDNIGLSLFISALPIVFILTFVYSKDKHQEPIKLLLILFLFGIISGFLVFWLSYYIFPMIPLMAKSAKDMNFLEILIYAFIGVALIEELFKWLMTYTLGYKCKEFDELYDGIVYAVFVSLGFACIENIFYILNNGAIYAAIIRAVSAVPGHACDAIFMGYYLSLAKKYSFYDKKKEKKYLLLSILIPATLHGIYDFCLMSNSKILVAIFVIYISFLYVISVSKLKQISNYNKKLESKIKICPICGNIVTNDKCSNCETSN